MSHLRPLADLTVPRLTGLFTDFDGTMTSDEDLVPIAYDRLVRARRAGLRTVIVTGRPGGYAEVLANSFAIDAAIAENGAVAMYRRSLGHQRALERLFWDRAEVRLEQQQRLEAVIASVRAELPYVKLANDRWLRSCDIAFDIGETVCLPRPEIARLAACIRAAGARVLLSTIHLHAYFGDHDKVRMLERLVSELWQEELSCSRERYVYVGDSLNDQAPFGFFPHSVGVANVKKYASELQPPPRYVTERTGGEGFAEAVDHLLGKSTG